MAWAAWDFHHRRPLGRTVPDADLLPEVDSDDIDPATDTLRPATRYAIRTLKDREPTGAVKDHLQATIARMPKRGQKGRW